MKAAVKALAQETEKLAGGPGYVVYAMLDPRAPDPFGEYKFKPIYVGMTRDIGTRICWRYHDAFEDVHMFTPSMELLRALAADGVLPAFAILDRPACEGDAVIAEVVWAQRLLARGYSLINMVRAQSRLLNSGEYTDYLQTRLWKLSTSAASEAGMKITTSCGWCGRTGVLIPNDFLAYCCASDPLAFVRDMAAHCYLCGSRISHEIILRGQQAPACNRGSIDWEA